MLACGAIAWEAVHRFNNPAPVAGVTVAIVAAIGVAINGFSAWLFMAGAKDDINIRGAYQHMAADAAISLGVVLSGLAIMGTGWTWLDPVVSIVIVLLILVSTWALLRESLRLVMAAVPITSVFLVAKALGLEPALTVNLISATFLLCGVGTLLQSFGPWKFGARLPFVMVPGGAPIVMFVTIAQQRDLQTASGAVILTALFYFLVLPVFARCLRYFPKIVIGTLLLLVSINLVKVYGGIIAGKAGSPAFADPVNIGLALATIGFTVLFARLFKGTLGQLSVLLGLLAGTVLAAVCGLMDFSAVAAGPFWSAPTLLPFGMPRFDL
eukprot:gene47515-63702_t